MVTSLTVGLSVVSRNITNLKTSTEEANSQKALSAAEAGVEKAVQQHPTNNTTLQDNSFGTDGKSSYVATVNQISQAVVCI